MLFMSSWNGFELFRCAFFFWHSEKFISLFPSKRIILFSEQAELFEVLLPFRIGVSVGFSPYVITIKEACPYCACFAAFYFSELIFYFELLDYFHILIRRTDFNRISLLDFLVFLNAHLHSFRKNAIS